MVADTIKNLSNRLSRIEKISIEFELSKTSPSLIQKIRKIRGITSVTEENGKLVVHMEDDKSEEVSRTIVNNGATIRLMRPKEYDLEDIFLQYYREDD